LKKENTTHWYREMIFSYVYTSENVAQETLRTSKQNIGGGDYLEFIETPEDFKGVAILKPRGPGEKSMVAKKKGRRNNKDRKGVAHRGKSSKKQERTLTRKKNLQNEEANAALDLFPSRKSCWNQQVGKQGRGEAKWKRMLKKICSRRSKEPSVQRPKTRRIKACDTHWRIHSLEWEGRRGPEG